MKVELENNLNASLDALYQCMPLSRDNFKIIGIALFKKILFEEKTDFTQEGIFRKCYSITKNTSEISKMMGIHERTVFRLKEKYKSI